MENFKLKLDRTKIATEEINSRQNFEQVLSKYKLTNPPVYKNPWFWGSAGLASLGLTTVISLNALTENKNDKLADNKHKNELPPDTECVKPPVKNEDISFTTYQVNAAKDQLITLESGTTLEIKKGSLLPADQTSPVELKIREFQDKASAFVAGIPMDCDDRSAFESAGMIEIRGVQDGKEVKINPEKPLTIQLVTTQNPEDFGFWSLNEADGKWNAFPAKKILPENNLSKASHQLSDKKSPVAATEKKIALLNKELVKDEFKIEKIESELKNLAKPTVESYKIPIAGKQRFDLDFDKSEYPELAKFENLVFEVVPEKGYDASFTKKNWSEVELTKTGEQYIMHFKSSKDSFKIPVRPILEGKELKVAEKKFDEAIAGYQNSKKQLENDKQEAVKKQEEHEKEINKLIQQIPVRDQAQLNTKTVELQNPADITEAILINGASAKMEFKATSWGIYNCDKPVAYPKPLAMGVAMMWISHSVAKFKQLFVFDRDKNTRYSYGSAGFQTLDNFGLNHHNDLVVVGIDENGEIGYAEISKKENNNQLEKIVFSRKDKSANTLDFLKKLLNETTDPA